MKVKCPYCGSDAKLVDGEVIYGEGRGHGPVWDCRPCDAYVGTHKVENKLHQPLGRLANRELRAWKQMAHNAFDPIWKDGYMNRTSAYKFLKTIMKLPEEHAHIGMFDVDQCKTLIERLDTWKPKRNKKRKIGGN